LYVVRAADVENLKLIVTRDISVATATTVSVDFAVLVEVALDGYLRVVSGGRRDVLPFWIARPSGRVVQVCRRFDLAIAVEIVIVYQIGIRSIQSVGQQVVVRVISILNLDDWIDPSVRALIRVIPGDEREAPRERR
tara:strand:- start:2 stop:412 length:411 start_codon:yes stop_codon:yes gene_type:complete